MSTLVTGGAGYIGSHIVYALLDRGEDVVVLDDLSTGTWTLVGEGATFVKGSVGDRLLVSRLLEDHKIDAVIHCAGSAVISDSLAEPLSYYSNNVAASCALIECCLNQGVENFIFSSTAAVYGNTVKQTSSENDLKVPASPYARSKLMIEWILEDAARVNNFRYMVLRYFNVAGADPKGRAGQSAVSATHLVRRAVRVALGRALHLDVCGTDYPTPDGTGIRDYIHVCDLAAAHLPVLDALRGGATSDVFNCGSGIGLSVREVIRAVERIAGCALGVREVSRRAGDPPIVVADPTKLRSRLLWRPRFDGIDEIIHSTLAWEARLQA